MKPSLPFIVISPPNPPFEIARLAQFIKGFTASVRLQGNEEDADTFAAAAHWLERASANICRQGYFGCPAGERCESDHK